jgi:hypothetical protein
VSSRPTARWCLLAARPSTLNAISAHDVLQRLGRVDQADPLEFGKEGSFEALVRWIAGG